MCDIIPLNEITVDNEKYGGKSVYLKKLLEFGCIVPDGVVIPSQYYEKYISGLLSEKDIQHLEACIKFYFPGDETLICRSSSNVENTSDYASCGVFSSFICRGSDSLYTCIENVWKSTIDKAAQSYLNLVGIDKSQLKMAVIVQRFIEGPVSAVIHSYDIIEDENRIIIEYTTGDVAEIVDGTVDAQTVYMDYSGNILGGENSGVVFSKKNKTDISTLCLLIENSLGAHVEIEAIITSEAIVFLQCRKII